jgi:hypothetical protein
MQPAERVNTGYPIKNAEQVFSLTVLVLISGGRPHGHATEKEMIQ